MQATIKVEKTVDIELVEIDIFIRHAEEDGIGDLPFLDDGRWNVLVKIDSGQILNWPAGVKSYSFSCKVTDSGSYNLFDKNGNIIASIEQDYAPNELIPGEYGDYIVLDIDETGLITNWPKHPSILEFFEN